MPTSVWSRLIFFLTVLGAVCTVASWFGPAGRLILLVLMGMFALQAAPVYAVYVLSRTHHRRRVLESIAAAGGRITARLGSDPRQILELDLSGTDLAELPWESFHALPEVESLNFAGTDLTDDNLDHLGRLSSLRRLCLDGTAVSDAAVAELRSFPHLRSLSLSDTSLTEEGLTRLHQTFPRVQVRARHLDYEDPFPSWQDVPYDTVF